MLTCESKTKQCLEALHRENQLDSLAFWSLVSRCFLFWLLQMRTKELGMQSSGHSVHAFKYHYTTVSLAYPRQVEFSGSSYEYMGMVVTCTPRWLLPTCGGKSKSITISALEAPPHRSVVFI